MQNNMVVGGGGGCGHSGTRGPVAWHLSITKKPLGLDYILKNTFFFEINLKALLRVKSHKKLRARTRYNPFSFLTKSEKIISRLNGPVFQNEL